MISEILRQIYRGIKVGQFWKMRTNDAANWETYKKNL